MQQRCSERDSNIQLAVRPDVAYDVLALGPLDHRGAQGELFLNEYI